MIWIISSFDTAKSLKEPQGTWMKEIWYAYSELIMCVHYSGMEITDSK